MMSVWPEPVDLALDEAPQFIGLGLLAQGCFPDFGIRQKTTAIKSSLREDRS